MPKDKSSTIVLQVRKNGVRVVKDGNYVYQWFGPREFVTVEDRSDFSDPDSRKFSITASSTQFRVEELLMREIEVDGFSY